MKTTFALFLVLGCAPTAMLAESPAELSIRRAQEQIAQHPGHVPYYNSLAMAYIRKAREMADVWYYDQADEVLRKSLALAPGNFEALKVRTWLQLCRHEFAEARKTAAQLNEQNPDDVTVYGYLADANAELGDYKEAVDDVQWMLNLRPGSVAALERAGSLRELHGDLAGAIEVMRAACDSTPFEESEERAWLVTRIAHLYLVSGDLREAETYANGSLALFPNYPHALGVLGQIRMAGKRYDEAVALFRKRYESAPGAGNLLALAEALRLAGHAADAARAFTDFERLSLAESNFARNSNHQLIVYYIDYAKQPARALAIARKELERRHDVFTIDAYAWALAANGDFARADVEIRKALALGVKDPGIVAHAVSIARETHREDGVSEAASPGAGHE